MKATKTKLVNTATKLGASVEFTPTPDGCCITVDAPDGMQWVDGGCIAFVGWHIKPWPISEVYADLIDRMQFGLDEIIEED